MPKPEYLIEDVVPERALVVLFGEPSAGKTFVALDWAMSVATGTEWCGRPVKQGLVVYVATEASGGLGARLRAWQRGRSNAPLDRLKFVIQAPQLMDPQHRVALLEALSSLPKVPVLIIVDTFARSMLGGDENSARDVGIAIHTLDQIRERTGATVVVVHHTTKSGTIERGSSALRGAADAMVSCALADQHCTLKCEKAKESAPFGSLTLRLERVELGEHGSSCYLKPVMESVLALRDKLEDRERTVLRALPPDGATFSQWQRAAEAAKVPKTSFERAIKALKHQQRVEKKGNNRGARYVPSKGQSPPSGAPSGVSTK